MKYFTFIPALALTASLADASPLFEGEYQCNDCNGLLEIHKEQFNYHVRIIVGSGSCGGEIVTEGTSSLLYGNKLNVSYKKNKPCVTTIQLDDQGATVSDSCYTIEDEENSTCATLGKYSKL